MLTDANSQWRRSIAFVDCKQNKQKKNKKNKRIILFLTKYELCCVNDNDDASFVFVCFVLKTRRNTF